MNISVPVSGSEVEPIAPSPRNTSSAIRPRSHSTAA
jgi:hypothetical protein